MVICENVRKSGNNYNIHFITIAFIVFFSHFMRQLKHITWSVGQLGQVGEPSFIYSHTFCYDILLCFFLVVAVDVLCP